MEIKEQREQTVAVERASAWHQWWTLVFTSFLGWGFPNLTQWVEGNAAGSLLLPEAPDCHINQPGLYDANKFSTKIWFGAWGVVRCVLQ